MNTSNKITKGFSNNYLIEKSIEVFMLDRKAQNLSKGTLTWYQKRLPEFGRYCKDYNISLVTEITPDLIRSYISHLREKGHNDGGVHTYYRTIKSFLFFFENEFEPENWKNPIRKVKAPRVTIEPIEGVSIEDIHKLLEVCEKNTFLGERNRTILQVLLETGVRASELLQLNIEDIDFSDFSILVKMGKGRKPRNVFIGRTVRRQLRKYLKFRKASKGALFISNHYERLQYFGLREIIRRLSKLAGIEEPGIHDFRRTFALEMLRRKVDIQTIARLMGHTSLQVISRYLKQTKADLGESFKSIIDDE